MDTIRKAGLVEFSKNYFWPISDAQYGHFVNSAMNPFEEVIVSADDSIFDLAIIDYRFLFFLVQHAHYRAAFSTVATTKTTANEFGSSLNSYINPNWQTHIDYLLEPNIRSGHFGNPRNSMYSKLGRPLRDYRDSFVLNLPKGIRKAMAAGGQLIHASIGPKTPMKMDFLSQRQEYVKVCEWNYFTSQSVQPDYTVSERLRRQFLEPFISGFRDVSAELGAELDINAVADCWGKRLSILYGFYQSFLSQKSLPSQLSISAAGNPIRKALGTASRHRGTKVFVFHHGECPGVERYPHAHRNDGSFSDFFVCPTGSIRKNFEQNYSASPIEQRSGTKYISSRSSHFRSMRDTYRSSSSVNNENTVMLIGFGMNHYRYLDGGGYFYYFQLDLQYRLCLLIKRLGYQLIYKVHPDRASEVGSLFDEVADTVERRPFELTWNNCSHYVFSHPGSTVFGHAVFTEKPILLLDIETNNWNSAGYYLLQKRCHTVSADFDSNNRLNFDELELEEKLANPLVLNDDYINSYSE